MINTLSQRDLMELVGILLHSIRALNKENARLSSQKIDIFKMGCEEHAKGLAEGNRFPLYCAVCGKPHTGSSDERLTYKKLKEMYDAAMRGKDDLSSAADSHAREAKKWHETSNQMAAAMRVYKDEADHHAAFLRDLADRLDDALAAWVDGKSGFAEIIKDVMDDIDEELDYEGTN